VAIVESCDNIYCRFNRDRSCTSSEVEFDENGICSTAIYDETPKKKKPLIGRQDDPGSDPTGQEGNEIIDHEPPSYGKDNDWIKYI